jgi:pyridinium-3,5-biscarboxylic acid mononucleotide synthase
MLWATKPAMKPEDLRALLEGVREGQVPVDQAADRLEMLPFQQLGFATVDHHRELRTGFPEVVYGAGKTVDQIAGIADAIVGRGQPALITRVDPDTSRAVIERVQPSTAAVANIESVSRMLFFGEASPPQGQGVIAVVSAGTSDQPVFEEAARTAEILGNEVVRIQDVGVAGLHRLLAHRDTLDQAQVVIVVAGMDGALPSVVAGLISRPVIAVPTSVGFGVALGGISALMTMLNSCAAGVTVVNIDNGFGAGYAATLINRDRSDTRDP